MVSASFKSDVEIFQGLNFLPETFIIENFVMGWAGLGGVTFATFFANSFFIAGVNIIGNVISCSFAAYAFAKVKFKYKKFWFVIMMGTMMLPMHVTLIPSYIMFNYAGWVNTFLPLTIPSFLGMNGFFIFMMTQFMRGIPKELDEASVIDGCNAWMHYLKVIMPLSLPALLLHQYLRLYGHGTISFHR